MPPASNQSGILPGDAPAEGGGGGNPNTGGALPAGGCHPGRAGWNGSAAASPDIAETGRVMGRRGPVRSSESPGVSVIVISTSTSESGASSRVSASSSGVAGRPPPGTAPFPIEDRAPLLAGADAAARETGGRMSRAAGAGGAGTRMAAVNTGAAGDTGAGGDEMDLADTGDEGGAGGAGAGGASFPHEMA
jgi:hypothetical protein